MHALPLQQSQTCISSFRILTIPPCLDKITKHIFVSEVKIQAHSDIIKNTKQMSSFRTENSQMLFIMTNVTPIPSFKTETAMHATPMA